MSGMKKGLGLVGPGGADLPSVDKLKEMKAEAEIEEISNVAYIVESGDVFDQVLDEVAKVIKQATIIPHPNRIYCMKVRIADFKSKSGLYLPTAFSISGDRAGKDGAEKVIERLFVIAVGSRFNEMLGYDNVDGVHVGDEVWLADYFGLERVQMPYVVDYEEFHKFAKTDNAFYYSFDSGEIQGWKPQYKLRKAILNNR